MAYKPPKDIWEVNARLQFNEPLEVDDPRYVETEVGRGEFSFDGLYKNLGIDPGGFALKSAPVKSYSVFCGHHGCGKSTELKRIAAKLDDKNL